MGNELQRLLDAFTRNLLAGEDDLADGIRGKIEELFRKMETELSKLKP